MITMLLTGLSGANAQKSQSDLHSEIETSLPSGRPDILTAESLRGVLHDMVTSAQQQIGFVLSDSGFVLNNSPGYNAQNMYSDPTGWRYFQNGMASAVTYGHAGPPYYYSVFVAPANTSGPGVPAPVIESYRVYQNGLVSFLVGSQSAGYVIANLPACSASNIGLRVYVTNGQTAPPFLGAVSATGTVTAPVFCNGTGWVYG